MAGNPVFLETASSKYLSSETTSGEKSLSGCASRLNQVKIQTLFGDILSSDIKKGGYWY